MTIAFAISILSLIVAAAALWIAEQMSNNAMRLSRELINDHAVNIARQANTYGDEIARLKGHVNMIDAEYQDYRQEFRGMINTHTKELEELRKFRDMIDPPLRIHRNDSA